MECKPEQSNEYYITAENQYKFVVEYDNSSILKLLSLRQPKAPEHYTRNTLLTRTTTPTTDLSIHHTIQYPYINVFYNIDKKAT